MSRTRAVRAALGLEAAGRAANVALLLDSAPICAPPSCGLQLRFCVRFEVRQTGSASRQRRGGPGAAPNPAGPWRAGTGSACRCSCAFHSFPADVGRGARRHAPPMHNAMMAGRTEPVELTVSIRLAGGDWLNVRTMFHRPRPAAFAASPVAPVADGGGRGLIAWWTARRVVGPMRTLAVGADRLGRGLDADPLPMVGPSEVRETTRPSTE